VGRIFWGMMGLLLAAAIHIGFVLFGPQQLFWAHVRGTEFGRKTNELLILQDETRRSLLPTLRGPGVAAVCNVDLSLGTVRMVLVPPQFYWSLAIFTQGGKQVYALNDSQADNDEINIDLVRAKPVLEQVFAKNAEEDEDVSLVDAAAWRVELVETHAYAVLWAPLEDPLEAPHTINALQASRCGLKKANG
jgi:uncharacterized membrane protein